MRPKFSDSPDKTLRKSSTASWKSLRGCPSLHDHMDRRWSQPQAKISGKHSFWNYPSCNVPENCFATRLLSDSPSWAASSHKASEALYTQKAGWGSSLPLLLPQVLPPTTSHGHTHLDSAAPLSIQTPHKPDLRGLSCSPWWVRNVSTAFRNLMPAIFYSNAQDKCLLRAYYSKQCTQIPQQENSFVLMNSDFST